MKGSHEGTIKMPHSAAVPLRPGSGSRGGSKMIHGGTGKCVGGTVLKVKSYLQRIHVSGLIFLVKALRTYFFIAPFFILSAITSYHHQHEGAVCEGRGGSSWLTEKRAFGSR